MSAVHSQRPSLAAHQYLLENLIKKECGKEHYSELWLRFAEAPVLERQTGLAALAAYEAQIPSASETKIDGLKQFYGVEDAGGLSFSRARLQADCFYAETSWTILRHQLTETAGVVSSREHDLEALWVILDGVHSAYCWLGAGCSSPIVGPPGQSEPPHHPPAVC